MVIQRWQSLLLLVAAVMMGCFSFCSLAQVQTLQFSLDFSALGFHYQGEPTDGALSGTFLGTWYFFILSVTTMLVYIIDIFLFGNLQLQKKVCLIGVLMTVASFAACAALGYNAVEGMQQIQWSSVFYVAPAFALIAAILAWSRMQSDQNKLRAADRIR